jgi:hypothetical protein
MVKSDKLESKRVFNALTIYDEAVDQLDSASQVCGEAVIDVFGPLLAFPWEEKTAEVLSRCVDLAIDFMKENQNQSKTFPVLIRSFINVIFQPELLAVPELNAEGGPMKMVMGR